MWMPFLLGFVAGMVAVSIFHFVRSNYTGLKSAKSKIYTSDAVILNLPDNSPTWMNLGLWNVRHSIQPSSSKFVDACANLALTLAQEAQFTSNDVVFDAGFGCGDQDFLWADRYMIKKIVAYNLSESQWRVAQSKNPDPSRLEFVCGDAVQGLAKTSEGHFSKIVSLDSAYHFRTRLDFLKQAHRCLQSNRGKFVAIDLALSRPLGQMSFYDRLRLRFIAYLAGIPQVNLWTEAEFEQNLTALGFSSVFVRPVTPRSDQDIFYPLSEHIRRTLLTYSAIVSSSTRSKFSAAARLMKFIADHDLFTVVIVSGEKHS